MSFVTIFKLSDVGSDLGTLFAEAVSVWLGFWAIRRKYDLDYKLDRSAQVMRWTIIAISVPLGPLVPEYLSLSESSPLFCS
jgi:hypothetical protein